MDEKMEQVLQDQGAVGFAVAVVEKDEVVYARGFGYRDMEGKEKVTEHTLFPVGSCTKTFTAALLGQLQDEGKLDIDEQVREYLPQLQFYNADMDRMITVRDMMCHRTGLPRHDFSWYLFPGKSREELLRRIKHQEPTAGVREQWMYNNFMYMALGGMIEEVTGESWEQNIRGRIFEPLGMQRSNTGIEALKAERDRAYGYHIVSGEREREDYYDIGAMSPAGSINSSVVEMSQWLITWINRGTYKGKQIFPETYYNEAIRPQMAIGGKPGKKHPDQHFSAYGLGWFLSSYRGHYLAEHGGNINGFSSSAAFFPTDSLGVIVLVNQNYSSVPGIVLNTIADHLLGLEPVDWNAEVSQSDNGPSGEEETSPPGKKEKTGRSRKAAYRNAGEYTGSYEHPGYGRFRIIQSGDSLIALTPTTRIWLKHLQYDIFETYIIEKGKAIKGGLPGQQFNFISSATGEIRSLEFFLQNGIAPLTFEKIPEDVQLRKDELLSYTGEFDMQGMTCKLYLKEEDLFLYVPGQPEYELLSLGGDKFGIKDLEGYALQFVKNDEASVEAVRFIQPNGVFEARKKK